MSACYLVDRYPDILMIRILALYSRRKQQLGVFAEPATDSAAARRLAYVLKMLLGLGAVVGLALMISVTLVEDSELLINPHKTKLDKFS